MIGPDAQQRLHDAVQAACLAGVNGGAADGVTVRCSISSSGWASLQVTRGDEWLSLQGDEHGQWRGWRYTRGPAGELTHGAAVCDADVDAALTALANCAPRTPTRGTVIT